MPQEDWATTWGADDLPLSRPRLADKQSAVFDHTDVDPFPNQPQEGSVTDPFLDHLDEQTSDDRVEVSGNIRFQNRRDRPTTNDSASLVQRVLWSTPGAESVAASS